MWCWNSFVVVVVRQVMEEEERRASGSDHQRLQPPRLPARCVDEVSGKGRAKPCAEGQKPVEQGETRRTLRAFGGERKLCWERVDLRALAGARALATHTHLSECASFNVRPKQQLLYCLVVCVWPYLFLYVCYFVSARGAAFCDIGSFVANARAISHM